MPRLADPSTAEKKPRAARARGAALVRKAPTALGATAARGRRAQAQLLGMVLGAILICAASVGVGVSDAGQIDVSSVIAARNAKVEAGETPVGEEANERRTATLPVQETPVTVPNGGLRGAGQPAPPPPPPVTATTSSSSAPAASSTEAASEGDAPSTDATESTSTAPTN